MWLEGSAEEGREKEGREKVCREKEGREEYVIKETCEKYVSEEDGRDCTKTGNVSFKKKSSFLKRHVFCIVDHIAIKTTNYF